MASDLFTLDDIKLALDGGDEQVRRFAGDDGTGAPRADRVAYGITVASEEGYAILLSGFPTVEKVQLLAANDPLVRHALVMIWREVLCSGRDEFRLPDGSTVFSKDARIARDALREKARGGKRTSAEAVVDGPGQSALLRPRSAFAIPSVMVNPRTGRPVGF